MNREARKTHVLPDGTPIELVLGGVKNYNLRMREDGSLRVSAPAWADEQDVLAFVASRRAWIEAHRQRLARRPEGEVGPAQLGELKERAQALVEQYEPLMGVHATRLRLRSMKTRWGSCNVRTGAITLNTRLALFPPECLEQVVVHELCHLLEPGHNTRFYALMDRYYPSWREARARLG